MKPNSKSNRQRDKQPGREERKHFVHEEIVYESMAGILERIDEGFVAFDNEMNYMYVNEQGGNLLGRKPEELIGKNCWKEYPEVKGSRFGSAYTHVLKTQIPAQVEEYYEPWDRWFENRIYPSKDGLSVFFRDITDRKQTDKQLKYQAQVLASVNDAVIATDENFMLTSWNQAAERIYGWKEHEVVGKLAEKILKTEFFSKTRADVIEELKETDKFSAAVTQVRKDGTRIDIEARTVALRDENGNVIGYASVNRDISQRKRTEEILREREERYRTIYETSGVSIWEEDFSEVKAALDQLKSQGVTDFRRYFDEHPEFVRHLIRMLKVMDVNEMTLRLYGAEDKRQLFRSFETIQSPTNIETFKEEFISLVEGKSYFEGEVIDQTLQGEPLYLWRTIVFPKQTAKFKNVLVCLTDITQRKQAEQALRNSEERFRALTENNWDAIALFGADGSILYGSPSTHRVLGYSLDEFVGRNAFELIHEDDRAFVTDRLTMSMQQPGAHIDVYARVLHKNGTWRWLEGVFTNLLHKPSVGAIVNNYHDFTERKQAEEALHASEETTRLIIDTALDAVITIDQGGQITRWNNQAESTFGWSRDEAVGRRLSELIIPPDLRLAHERGLRHYFETGEGPILGTRIEITAQRRDGSIFPVELTVHVLKTNRKVSFAAFVRDITERKQAEAALNEAHEHLERLVQERTAALSQANTLLQTMLDHVPDHIFFKDLQSRFLRNSRSQAEMLGLSDPSEVVGKSDFDFFPHAQQAYEEEQAIIQSGQPRVDFEEHVIWPDGRETWVSTTKVPLRNEHGEIIGTFGIARDITERKRADELLRKAKDELEVRVAERTAELNKTNNQLRLELRERKQIEENLRATELRYRSLVEQLPIIVYTNPANNIGSTTYVSPQIKPFLGYTQEEWLKDPRFWGQALHPEDRQRVLSEVERVNRSGEPFNEEYRMLARDGRVVWIRDQATLLRDTEGKPLVWQGLMIDITDRKQTEEALKSSETRYRLATRATNDVIWDLDRINDLHVWNENVQSLFGYTPDEASSDPEWWKKHIHVEDRERVLTDLKTFYEGSDTIWADEYRFLRKDGSIAYITDRGYIERDISGKPIRMIGAMSDITARKLAEDQLRHRVDHLKSLRIIDMTITSSTDLHFSLQTVLKQAISQLQVDAADILLLNPTTHLLEFSVGTGFLTKAIERSSVRVGEGYAGRAALERKIIHIYSLFESGESFSRRSLLESENFTAYYGVPLIAKGEVKGVLEVFHRTHLEVDQEWLDFLESVAGQAGLAIDNATLFQNLQRSNLELGMAYESTLEGWSAALDLRDKETEGHTLRVTNLTLQLAKHMGLQEKALVHIRRGALLHDIGKMGVPDRILLKPDNLTDDEWEIMRRHPIYAHEMLSRIEYLRSSLGIPYCHHEKWDGSGYPRGLKGEEIPLDARIFAVVDVYDALTSDRPYRPAWSKERALEYITSLSGTHFDARVVEAFIEMLNRGS